MQLSLPLLPVWVAAAGCNAQPGVEIGASGGAALCGAIGESAQAIVRGDLDEGDPAVVSVNTLHIDCQRAGAPLCTGTLIGQDVVLTAAHCAFELPVDSLGVLFGPQADPGPGPLGDGLDGLFFRVMDVRIHPAFDPDTYAHDVALLRLEGIPQVTPVPRLAEPLDPSFVASTARVVGFGAAGPDPACLKRDGTVRVAEMSAEEFVYQSDPSMTCTGDSGGPVLAPILGTEMLVGVTSRGDPACEDHGVAIRVDTLAPEFFDAF